MNSLRQSFLELDREARWNFLNAFIGLMEDGSPGPAPFDLEDRRSRLESITDLLVRQSLINAARSAMRSTDEAVVLFDVLEVILGSPSDDDWERLAASARERGRQDRGRNRQFPTNPYSVASVELADQWARGWEHGVRSGAGQ